MSRDRYQPLIEAERILEKAFGDAYDDDKSGDAARGILSSASDYISKQLRDEFAGREKAKEAEGEE